MTETGSALHKLAVDLDTDLGMGSTAALVAPSTLADRLRGMLAAVANQDFITAQGEYFQVQTNWRRCPRQRRHGSPNWPALGGAPDEVKVTRMLETILAYVEAEKTLIDAVGGPQLANPEVAARVRDHLRDRVEPAKTSATREGDANWHDRLAQELDYRHWFEVSLHKKIGREGHWTPLTRRSFAEMSGGARAVMLMLPLVATLAACYSEMPEAPRPLWLDEAFEGLDSANRATVMDLFHSFDLDVLLAGPARLVNVSACRLRRSTRWCAPRPPPPGWILRWSYGPAGSCTQSTCRSPCHPDYRPSPLRLPKRRRGCFCSAVFRKLIARGSGRGRTSRLRAGVGARARPAEGPSSRARAAGGRATWCTGGPGR